MPCWVSAVLLVSPALLGQAPNFCDPALRVEDDSALKYQLRGDRCEGLFRREVSAKGTISVLSLFGRFPDFSTGPNQKLVVAWPSSQNLAARQLSIRAVSLRNKSFYRMDTSRPASAGQFDWPVNVLAGLNLARADLGVVAWSKVSLPSGERDVYVPIDVTQQGGIAPVAGLSVVLWSGVQLSSLSYKIFAIGADGLSSKLVSANDSKNAYYPAARPIPLNLTSKFDRDVIYRMDVVADSSDGGVLGTQLFFFGR